ncbi:hypothetical protein BXZ70DRAFT_911690 [Cristinia sonorae]|uniref:Uncharacterized protein n=1 Tax=Cristinia sonorae TaxID=1940300 RepID=A0A8K0UDR9_9AGAR|nr:hypothetical protein BXZ70DRAFT_911690 [Cristinia sonorae]
MTSSIPTKEAVTGRGQSPSEFSFGPRSPSTFAFEDLPGFTNDGNKQSHNSASESVADVGTEYPTDIVVRDFVAPVARSSSAQLNAVNSQYVRPAPGPPSSPSQFNFGVVPGERTADSPSVFDFGAAPGPPSSPSEFNFGVVPGERITDSPSVFDFGAAPGPPSSPSQFNFRATPDEQAGNSPQVFDFGGERTADSPSVFDFGAAPGPPSSPSQFNFGATPDEQAGNSPQVFDFGGERTADSPSVFDFGAAPGPPSSPSEFNFGVVPGERITDSPSVFNFGAAPGPCSSASTSAGTGAQEQSAGFCESADISAHVKVGDSSQQLQQFLPDDDDDDGFTQRFNRVLDKFPRIIRFKVSYFMDRELFFMDETDERMKDMMDVCVRAMTSAF